MFSRLNSEEAVFSISHVSEKTAALTTEAVAGTIIVVLKVGLAADFATAGTGEPNRVGIRCLGVLCRVVGVL